MGPCLGADNSQSISPFLKQTFGVPTHSPFDNLGISFYFPVCAPRQGEYAARKMTDSGHSNA
jgi:hypothetical protein